MKSRFLSRVVCGETAHAWRDRTQRGGASIQRPHRGCWLYEICGGRVDRGGAWHVTCVRKRGFAQTHFDTGAFPSHSLRYRGTSALNSPSTPTLVFGVDQKKIQNQPQNRSPGAFSANKGVTVKRALRARRSFCLGSGATHSCGESRRHLGNQAKTHPHLSTPSNFQCTY